MHRSSFWFLKYISYWKRFISLPSITAFKFDNRSKIFGRLRIALEGMSQKLLQLHNILKYYLCNIDEWGEGNMKVLLFLNMLSLEWYEWRMKSWTQRLKMKTARLTYGNKTSISSKWWWIDESKTWASMSNSRTRGVVNWLPKQKNCKLTRTLTLQEGEKWKSLRSVEKVNFMKMHGESGNPIVIIESGKTMLQIIEICDQVSCWNTKSSKKWLFRFLLKVGTASLSNFLISGTFRIDICQKM